MAKSLNKKPSKIDGPASKSKRPLSAYNIFALLERNRILLGESVASPRPYSAEDAQRACFEYKCRGKRAHRKTSGRIGFHEMSRIIVERWKNLDGETRAVLTRQAAIEKQGSSATGMELCKEIVQDENGGSTKISPKTAVDIEVEIQDLKQKIQVLESIRDLKQKIHVLESFITQSSKSNTMPNYTQLSSSSDSIIDPASLHFGNCPQDVSKITPFVWNDASEHDHCSIMPFDWTAEVRPEHNIYQEHCFPLSFSHGEW